MRLAPLDGTLVRTTKTLTRSIWREWRVDILLREFRRRMIRRSDRQSVGTEKHMAQANVAPSIESLLRLAPEEPDSWVLGSNPKVSRIARHVERAADVGCTVLITGETGTGKEVWARLLHRLGTAPRQAVRPRQLRRAHADLGRKPIVRPRERRVYRRGRTQLGRVSRCCGRHGVSRRSRRNAASICSPSCCACCSRTKSRRSARRYRSRSTSRSSRPRIASSKRK